MGRISTSERRRRKGVKNRCIIRSQVADKRCQIFHDISASGHFTAISRDKVFQLRHVDVLGEPESEAEKVDVDEEEPPEEEEKETQTQTREAIEAFLGHLDLIEELAFERHANPYAHENCFCGNGMRVVHCRDCLQYETSCQQCFIDNHRTSPLHWAYVWDFQKGFFSKHDYSSVLSEGSVIQLGHNGRRCPRPAGYVDMKFSIIHTNGVHATKLRFCECDGPCNRVAQLMRAQVFPGTVTEPITGFTFEVLKLFHVFNLQSKCGAFDFSLSLRQLTDNVFIDDVPNHYKLLLRVARIWEHLVGRRRMGQAHNIDRYFPERPKGNVVMHCPSCPEPGVNMQEGWEATPESLSHLISLDLALDGNFHANRYRKNTDPNDYSLWNGTSYFPSYIGYHNYLNQIPVDKEKSVCNFISAVNSQDSKKFRGNDETGLINVHCTHGMVVASTDMYLGERFAYSDAALARALKTRSTNGLRIVVAYDSACSYSVKFKDRFRKYIPSQLHQVLDIKFIIDSLHVSMHKIQCMYLFSAAYFSPIGRFAAVIVEQYWAENNQMGPQTRQMNRGHRQDKIIDHHSRWNWMKTRKQAETLRKDLKVAKRTYEEKKDHFIRLSATHRDRVPAWYALDRTAVAGPNGDIKSVYKHNSSKIPSLDSVHQRLLMLTTDLDKPIAHLSSFLKEGLQLEMLQSHLREMVKVQNEHPLVATKRDIIEKRRSLSERTETWRTHQRVFMGSVLPHILSLPSCDPEMEPLLLPSHFTLAERDSLSMTEAAKEEADLREGQAYDLILRMRSASKHLDLLQGLKAKNTRGQKQATRAYSRIERAKFVCGSLLSSYKGVRSALASLSRLDGETEQQRFPNLSFDSLFRKSTTAKKGIGDTYRSDGEIWRSGHSFSFPSVDSRLQTMAPMETDDSETPSMATQMHRREVALSRQEAGTRGLSKSPEAPKESTSPAAIPAESHPSSNNHNSIWEPKLGIPDEDLLKWEEEEDRVQWFRAWADMLRWLEEYEKKHAEFIRTMKFFDRTQSVWEDIALSRELSAGRIAYAKRQAAVYRSFWSGTLHHFKAVGHPEFVDLKGQTLAAAVDSFHTRELLWLAEHVKQVKPLFHFPNDARTDDARRHGVPEYRDLNRYGPSRLGRTSLNRNRNRRFPPISGIEGGLNFGRILLKWGRARSVPYQVLLGVTLRLSPALHRHK